MYILFEYFADVKEAILVSKDKNKLINYITEGENDKWEIEIRNEEDEPFEMCVFEKYEKFLDREEYFIEEVEEI